MIVGIGVDVVDVARFERVLSRTPTMAARLFVEAERGLPMASLAGRFAAKEAVAKTLGSPPGLGWHDAWVERGAHGRPLLRVGGPVASAAAQLGITHWHLSISHDGGVAAAYVVAEARPGPAGPPAG
ncbi:holo-ACP synthase [Agilicoccus flavus]|uniref:holo-ACP synthase n=1 Tax=Agilicoccus flavus TaxID=2775968 RepID=UPI001CF71150|nr:holo-ACP synthase [Agilicoccus flavus]